MRILPNVRWRWFLAGYAVAPLLYAIEHGTQGESVIWLVAMVPIEWLVAPLGLIVAILGMVNGIGPEWGPWDGRPVLMGLAAGVVVLVAAGRWLEKRNPVPNGADDTPRIPSAQVMTVQQAYRVPWVAQNQLIGRILLASAGACLFFLGGVGCAVEFRVLQHVPIFH